jgi:hypothetical protein
MLHVRAIGTGSNETVNSETVEPAGVNSHSLSAARARGAVVLIHQFADAVGAVIVYTATGVDRFHTLIPTAIRTAFVVTGAVIVYEAGIVASTITLGNRTIALFNG